MTDAVGQGAAPDREGEREVWQERKRRGAGRPLGEDAAGGPASAAARRRP